MSLTNLGKMADMPLYAKALIVVGIFVGLPIGAYFTGRAFAPEQAAGGQESVQVEQHAPVSQPLPGVTPAADEFTGTDDDAWMPVHQPAPRKGHTGATLAPSASATAAPTEPAGATPTAEPTPTGDPTPTESSDPTPTESSEPTPTESSSSEPTQGSSPTSPATVPAS